MRLDDWQKWLEDQFLDTNPPEPKADEERAAADSRHVRTAVAVLDAPESREPPQDCEEPAPCNVTNAAAPSRESRLMRPQAESSSGVLPDVELPRIENYLPFLRTRMPQPLRPARASVPATPPADVVAEEGHKGPSASPDEAGPAPGSVVMGVAGTDVNVARQDAEPLIQALELGAAEPAPSAALAEATPVVVGPEPPRPSRKRRGRAARHVSPPELAPPLTSEAFWELAPRHVRTLISMGHDDDVQRSYRRQFKESRLALIERLLDPTLSLEDTARLLNVCPTTVRRYTNRGQLRHQRTPGDQRRFRLSDVLSFMEAQQPDDLR